MRKVANFPNATFCKKISNTSYKESQPLTTFLTPSGSFQWLSLPTGAANSPAHFSTAIDKILNYVPVLDRNGKPIFESENVVKLERNVLEDTVSYFDDIIVTSELRPTYEKTLSQHFENLENYGVYLKKQSQKMF